jgi:hypothetical protein
MALNVGLDVSYDNMYYWIGMREKAGKLIIVTGKVVSVLT